MAVIFTAAANVVSVMRLSGRPRVLREDRRRSCSLRVSGDRQPEGHEHSTPTRHQPAPKEPGDLNPSGRVIV